MGEGEIRFKIALGYKKILFKDINILEKDFQIIISLGERFMVRVMNFKLITWSTHSIGLKGFKIMDFKFILQV